MYCWNWEEQSGSWRDETMGKPKSQAFRLLRSCLFFSGHKHNKRDKDDDVKQLGLGGGGHHPDGEGDASAAVSPPPPPLPEDMIFDVLSRLPVKTLCRFRCVCKAWRGLISSPGFASAQASRAAAAPLVVGVFGFGTPPSPRDKFLPAVARRFPDPSLELRVLDSGGGGGGGSVVSVVKDVGGRKLMYDGGRLVMVDQGERGARVIDPATGRVMVLGGETTETTTTTTTTDAVYLYGHGRRRTAAAAGAGAGAGDDDDYVHPRRLCCYSLGRATPSGAYKVVRLRDGSAKQGDVQICHVATVPWDTTDGDSDDATRRRRRRRLCWRQRPEPAILTCCCASCTAVVHGVLYLMRPSSRTSHCDAPAGFAMSQRGVTSSRVVSIASFDLESEEWKPTVITGPPAISNDDDDDVGSWDDWKQALAVLRGSLCLIQTDHVGSSRFCTNIWFLVDPERSIWVKEYAVQRPQSWCLFTPLEILVDGRILMLNAFKEKEQDGLSDVRAVLQLYHPSAGALTDIMEMGNDFRGPLTLYTGNLLS